jgi:carbon-monoxide dehydrogenase medium subunit
MSFFKKGDLMQFEYLRPCTVQEVVSLLKEYGVESKVIAGGTDLVVQIRDGMINPRYVIDIAGISKLKGIKGDLTQGIRIGALTTISDLEKSPVLKDGYSIISQAARQLGSEGIRNVGTIGGNLCNAAPSAEMAPALLVLSAKAKVVSPEGTRVVPLEDFFAGPGKTALKPWELVTEIQVPIPLPNSRGVYLKHSIRGTIELAIVGVAAILTFNLETGVCLEAKIGLGAVALTPMRARNAEKIILGKILNDELIESCGNVAADEAKPISDIRASKEYRREMVKVFVRQAIKRVCIDLKTQFPKGVIGGLNLAPKNQI